MSDLMYMATIILKHFRKLIFRKSFVTSFKGFLSIFEMKELGASEAHKTEILDYDVLDVLKI